MPEKVLLHFSYFPLDQGESPSAPVAQALDVVDQSGLPYRLGPRGTSLGLGRKLCT